MNFEPSLMLPGVVPSRTARTAPAGAPAAPRFADVLQWMQQGRWHQAFAACAELADAGYGPAARLALLFAERGTRLFGGRYPATDRQRTAWRRIGR
jgi:hypothetical protein